MTELKVTLFYPGTKNEFVQPALPPDIINTQSFSSDDQVRGFVAESDGSLVEDLTKVDAKIVAPNDNWVLLKDCLIVDYRDCGTYSLLCGLRNRMGFFLSTYHSGSETEKNWKKILSDYTELFTNYHKRVIGYQERHRGIYAQRNTYPSGFNTKDDHIWRQQ